MEVAEFGYFESMWWVSQMGIFFQSLRSALDADGFPSWQSGEEAEDYDQKEREGALPEENLKYSLV